MTNAGDFLNAVFTERLGAVINENQLEEFFLKIPWHCWISIRWTSLSYAFLFLYLWVYIWKSNPLVCPFVSVDLDFVFCCCCLCVCVEMHSSRRHFNNLSYFPVGNKNSEWSLQGGLLNLGFKFTRQVSIVEKENHRACSIWKCCGVSCYKPDQGCSKRWAQKLYPNHDSNFQVIQGKKKIVSLSKLH